MKEIRLEICSVIKTCMSWSSSADITIKQCLKDQLKLFLFHVCLLLLVVSVFCFFVVVVVVLGHYYIKPDLLHTLSNHTKLKLD